MFCDLNGRPTMHDPLQHPLSPSGFQWVWPVKSSSRHWGVRASSGYFRSPSLGPLWDGCHSVKDHSSSEAGFSSNRPFFLGHRLSNYFCSGLGVATMLWSYTSPRELCLSHVGVSLQPALAFVPSVLSPHSSPFECTVCFLLGPWMIQW